MKKQQKGKKFTQLLMLWHEKDNTRQMPWKGEKDPYKIWLSEIILQQTRVEQGTAYFNRFVAKYPNITALANAQDTDVFKLWEGLGYYNRCKNMLATSRFIWSELNAVFPHTYESLLKLKGVGPYTAAAIASFAYDLPNAVVDGNVYRVLARYFGVSTPVDSKEGKAQFTELAEQVLDPANSALYNQAIMDFGATICKPAAPLCSLCPLSKHCVALQGNIVGELPVKDKKLIRRKRWFYYLVIESNEKFLVKKRTGNDIWQNLHEFLLIETREPTASNDILASTEIGELQLNNVRLLNVSDTLQQQLTHQTIYATFIALHSESILVPDGMEMVEKNHMEELAFPRIINKYMEQTASRFPEAV